MKAEAEGRIDSSERDRLLAELEELKKKQEDESRKKREQQQKLLQARLLQKRLQGKKTSSEQQDTSGNSQATGTDNQAMMMIAESEALIKENHAFESLKMELDLEIDAFEKRAEAELQALEAEYKKELEKNPSSEEAARLLADLEARKKEMEEHEEPPMNEDYTVSVSPPCSKMQCQRRNGFFTFSQFEQAYNACR